MRDNRGTTRLPAALTCPYLALLMMGHRAIGYAECKMHIAANMNKYQKKRGGEAFTNVSHNSK